MRFGIISGAFLLLNVWAQQPNLIIFHTDEHNFRTLGCYREQLTGELAFPWGPGVAVETPHIDSMAHHGVICNSFYANTPVCSPSRSSFVSGLYPVTTPVVTNNIPMDGSIATFASVLADNGYTTGYAGKWHLDGTGKPQWEPERRFGFEDNRYMFNRGHWKKFEITDSGPRVACRDANDNPTYGLCGADSLSFSTDWLARRALDFIEANKSTPFCYMVSFPDPHGPNTVRPPYDTMYDYFDYQKPPTESIPADGLPTWAEKANSTIGASGLSKYFGMVRCIDDNVGMIVDFLRKESLLENTILVFTSDHGDLLGEHGRDNKGVPFEASMKIPFILQYPGKVPEGLVIDDAMSVVDFMPTILSLMGIANPAVVEGTDASALFLDQPSERDDIGFIRGTGDSTSGGSANWVGAVTSEHKIIYSADNEPWLFDLTADPDELVNYYNDPAYAGVVKYLAGRVKEYGDEFSDDRVLFSKISSELDAAMALSVKHSGSSLPDRPLFRYDQNRQQVVLALQDYHGPLDISVFNKSGRRCPVMVSRDNGRVGIDLRRLPNGIYIVRAEYAGQNAGYIISKLTGPGQ